MFCKNETIKKIGDVILGFGVLFMGIKTMSGAMGSLNDSGQITEVLQGLRSPLVAIITGTVITAIVQSSSVTVSIVLLMSLWDFMVLLFGCGAIVEIMLGEDDGEDIL